MISTKKLFGNSKGYTIIELLAVASILVILSGIITAILYTTLRGSSKTSITTGVSQNGNYAISVITNTVIDSKSVTQINGSDIADCTGDPSGTSITLQRLDGNTTTLSCSNNVIASNSASLIDSNQVQVASNSCVFSCSQANGDPYAIPIVDVKFTVSDINAQFLESQSSQAFETSVSLRNFEP